MSPQKNAHKAYSAATRTVAKTRQIVMLYDGAIRFIAQAQTAISEKRVEDRFRLLKRASDVIVGLQNSIDFENGGEIANTLHRFYTEISMRILQVNMQSKEAMQLCDGITQDLKQMRDTWDTIDRGAATSGGSNASSSGSFNSSGSATASGSGDSMTLSA